MNCANIRKALGRIAWAYLIILLHFRINNLDLLPDWVGYLLIFSAIGHLAGEVRDLPLLRPFCVLLGIAAGVDWLAFPLAGESLTGRFLLLSALISCVSIYFHFQLLTDLARLAEEHPAGDGPDPLARRLRIFRNIDAVLSAAKALLGLLPLPVEGILPELLLGLSAISWLWMRVAVAFSLFTLRGRFPEAAPSQP